MGIWEKGEKEEWRRELRDIAIEGKIRESQVGSWLYKKIRNELRKKSSNNTKNIGAHITNRLQLLRDQH